jgi:hypothetical protein
MSGTYAAYHVSEETKNALVEFCELIGISDPVLAEDFHTTLLYSKKTHDDYVPDVTLVFEAKFKGFEVFSTSSGTKALVLLLDCPELEARHSFLMEQHQATYDFETYHPHISLTYLFYGEMNDLPAYIGPLILISEFKEDIHE